MYMYESVELFPLFVESVNSCILLLARPAGQEVHY